MEPLRVRSMTSADLPALQALTRERNVHAREYERFLGLEGAHGLVLETAEDASLPRAGPDAASGRAPASGPSVIGAITLMRYFEHGFLGPVLMPQSPDAVGLTIALLAQAIERLQASGVAVIEAEAGEEEAAVLRRMGFEAVRGTLVYQRDAAESRSAGGTRAMTSADLLDVGALDADAAGYGRKQYIAALLAEHPYGARVAEGPDGDITGYVMLRRARRGYHVGPLVTRGDEPATLAEALLRDALASVPTWPAVALAPDDPRMRDVLERAGFAEVGELTRLRAGKRDASTAREWLLGGRITG